MPKLTNRFIGALKPVAVEAFHWDSEVKGFGLRVKPSGSMSFVLKYRIGAQSKRFTISKVGSPYTADQAREIARDLLVGVKVGLDPATAKSELRTAVTVGELVDLYLDEGPALKPNKKASSWATDRSVLQNHVKPLLGRKLARDLTPQDVSKFQAEVAGGKTARDVKLGPRARSKVTGGKRVAALSTAILGAAYQFGIDTHRVKDNPTRGVSLYKADHKERFLSAGEVAAVAEAISEMEETAVLSSTMADAARLLLVTGARKTEILALRWEWVDFQHSCLRLPDSKTGAKIINLASVALALLSRRMAARSALPKNERSPFVFPAARGDGYSVGLSKAWGAIKILATEIVRERVATAGGDPEAAPSLLNVRIHDLRHTFASFAVADGGSLLMVGKVLGHKQTRTTEIYAHLADDPIKGLTERTASRINDAMGPKASANVVAMSRQRRKREGRSRND